MFVLSTTLSMHFLGPEKGTHNLNTHYSPGDEGAEAPVVYLQLVSTFLKTSRVLEKQSKVVANSGSLCFTSGALKAVLSL